MYLLSPAFGFCRKNCFAFFRMSRKLALVTGLFAKQFAGIDIDVTISAGAVTEINLFSSQEMFKFADIALYKAKQKGKDCYQLYEKEKTAEIS